MAQDDFVIGDISMDGFQVVRGQYFSRQLEPALTLWRRSISFNIPAYNALNNCESVQLLVNPDAKRILVKPAPSKDSDAINWIPVPAGQCSYVDISKERTVRVRKVVGSIPSDPP